MAEDLLAFSADGPWQSWQMAENLLALSADGPGFLGILSWISQQLAKNLSVFLADCLEFLGKVGQEFVSIPGFVSKWPRISWHFGQIAQQAFLVKLTEDFWKLLAADHKD